MIIEQVLYFIIKENIQGFLFDLLVMHQSPSHNKIAKRQKMQSFINAVKVQDIPFELI